jgi:hypothetical protein
VWFHSCWLFATAKDGISALSLQRSLEIGSYQAAWATPGPTAVGAGAPGLADTVEADETYTGGEEPGCAAGGGLGQEGPDRHRDGGQAAEGDRPMPDGPAG